jgi:hypothetical protein
LRGEIEVDDVLRRTNLELANLAKKVEWWQKSQSGFDWWVNAMKINESANLEKVFFIAHKLFYLIDKKLERILWLIFGRLMITKSANFKEKCPFLEFLYYKTKKWLEIGGKVQHRLQIIFMANDEKEGGKLNEFYWEKNIK